MAKILGIVVIVLVAAVVLFVATRPDHFHVERSGQINAPPHAAYALINDFHRWVEWSPYEKLDPNVARSYEGPTSGAGAVYAYKGNNNVGEGRMTILESRPGELVNIELVFIKPFAARNQATFKLEPSGTGTRVTWTMAGPNTLMGKLMSPFMDGFIGKSMEQGLAALDTAAQAEAKKLPPPAQAQAR
ncbi:SRPBCC family protein [Pyxidicoccus fallax]|uniref:SRPBCC family protein n=1 Tax=Pyxidicoccus fallax TaxID=394095 RepID=A0A848LR01_9BACT|nr:SRPBCC family protein [Pyxidicoccus fallax]NMO19894.1 SRPBCC family protein [Pyxidicoccus fallax]NPC83111.1 SRPBCC family protein [Pyxidicoccus fallax]